jgi:tRNA(fMet)-specific endonuclease VapC
MNERLAIDSSAAIDLLRARDPSRSTALPAEEIVLPLPVAGELFAGAFTSPRAKESLGLVELFISRCRLLVSDEGTARLYGELRARQGIGRPITPSKSNDLWIAALCIQHDLPLLTNDRGFERIARLRVVRW